MTLLVASLIAPGIILTAAHKLEHSDGSGKLIFYGANELTIRCGEWDVAARTEYKDHQDRLVRSITIHPQYEDRDLNLRHDLALLHLKEDFILDEHLDTVCLPGTPLDRINNYKTTHECVVMGWGKDRADLSNNKNNLFQNIMKAVKNLPIVQNDDCEQNFKDNIQGLPDSFKLHHSFVCAGGEEGVDACDGDGGGPLVCPHLVEDNRYVLAGVVADGAGCGTAGVPGRYASVSENLCFIHWATKCKEGKKYEANYWYPECNDWMDKLKPTLPGLFFQRVTDIEKECK